MPLAQRTTVLTDDNHIKPFCIDVPVMCRMVDLDDFLAFTTCLNAPVMIKTRFGRRGETKLALYRNKRLASIPIELV